MTERKVAMTAASEVVAGIRGMGRLLELYNVNSKFGYLSSQKATAID